MPLSVWTLMAIPISSVTMAHAQVTVLMMMVKSAGIEVSRPRTSRDENSAACINQTGAGR